jgi:hypothetical protein
LIVPAEAVWEADGRSFVSVRSGEGFARRAIRLGERNNTQVAVVAGLKAGEEVALEPVR